METTFKKIRKKRNSMTRRSLQKFLSNKLAVAGVIVVVLLILLSFLQPVFSQYKINDMDTANRNSLPTAEHLLGTDNLGRDFLTRLFYGGQISITISMISAILGSILGVTIGCISGYFGGVVDRIMLFVQEIFSTFPVIIIVLILVGFVGRSLTNLVLIFAFTGWMSTSRIVRSKVLSLREEPFVEFCRGNGISNFSIMFRQLLPNTLGPVIVSFTLHMAGYVLAEAGLSFIGLGAPSEIPTWGNLINAGKSLTVIQNYPVLWIAPGVIISLFVLSVNFFGDGLRDALDAKQE